LFCIFVLYIYRTISVQHHPSFMYATKTNYTCYRLPTSNWKPTRQGTVHHLETIYNRRTLSIQTRFHFRLISGPYVFRRQAYSFHTPQKTMIFYIYITLLMSFFFTLLATKGIKGISLLSFIRKTTQQRFMFYKGCRKYTCLQLHTQRLQIGLLLTLKRTLTFSVDIFEVWHCPARVTTLRPVTLSFNYAANIFVREEQISLRWYPQKLNNYFVITIIHI